MNKALLAFIMAIFLCKAQQAPAQIIITYAGDTTAGNSGDGLAATNAKINQPYGIATDDAGNLYIADAASHCVRKVNTAGIISTIAGTGVSGFNGDTIAATSARLNKPISVATDAAGNVYISDNLNARIRKVSPSGIITSVFHSAPSPLIAPQTVAVNRNGVVYFSAASSIYKVVSGSAVLVASGATITGGQPLQVPDGLAFDSSGRLYILNSAGSIAQIFRMDTAGAFTMLAGNNMTMIGCGTDTPKVAYSTWLNDGYGIARDDSGNIFYSDIDSRIMRINTAGITARYAGVCGYGDHAGDGGSPLLAHIDIPYEPTSFNCIAVNHAGDLFIAEPYYHCVRKIIKRPPSLDAPVAHADDYCLSVYPCPNDGHFNILYASPVHENAALIITDILGRQRASFTISTNIPFPADLHLPPGAYTLTARTAGGTVKKVFAVQ